VLLVSSAAFGAAAGRGLGQYGYSYDFVLRAFLPLLERWGEVVLVDRPESRLDFAVRRAQLQGREAVHLCFRPLPDVYFTRLAPNVVFPFWEFPDLPDREYNDDPRTVWTRAAAHASMILSACRFTADTFARRVPAVPVRVVPVPLPDHPESPPWSANGATVLGETVFASFGGDDARPARGADKGARGADKGAHGAVRPRVRQARQRVKSWLRRLWLSSVKPRLPERVAFAIVDLKNALAQSWARPSAVNPPPADLKLTGLVYATVLNPEDHRKNWEDVVSAFVWALRDEDATLVVKLVAGTIDARFAEFMARLGEHRCRVVFLTGYLSDDVMRRLAEAATYYVHATRAEGACLPLQEFLAAGRPALSPRHTAMEDYFDDGVGFPVRSSPEPCGWPGDREKRLTTTWHRIDWMSLCEQFRTSFDVATQSPRRYVELSAAAARRMAEHAGRERVWQHLKSALDESLRNHRKQCQPAADRAA
jgi:glycosyltransferase involved in cell wall biosynthesis